MDTYVRETLQSAATATGNGNSANVRGFEGVTFDFQNTGSPVGTITFEAAVDDTNFQPIPVRKSDGTFAATTTAVGLFTVVGPHGYSQVRARISAYTSGAFTVVLGKKPR